MTKYVFGFKSYDTKQDRDCVAYFDVGQLKTRRVCIDGKFNIHGPCYSMSFNDDYQYGYMKTILSLEEFKLLQSGRISDEIIEKLLSEDNQRLFNEIIEEETEYLMENYGLYEDDVNQIFNEYYLDYRDRGIVGYVFKDSEDLGYEEAYSLGYMNDGDSISSRYFDYKKFGEDLLDEENYLELSDGRVVSLMY